LKFSITPATPKLHQKKLRQSLRAARRDLSPLQQKFAAQALAKNCSQLFVSSNFNQYLPQRNSHPSQPSQASQGLGELNLLSFRQLKIASYIAGDGEIQTQALHRFLVQQGHSIYLPIIQSNGQLQFGLKPHNRRLARRNRFGILEPLRNKALKAQQLDIIVLPLVGFTHNCDRIGMGGGFYDKTLNAMQSFAKKPLLIGLAHSLQQVEVLSTNPWDYPLDIIITDKTLFKRPAVRRW